MLVSSHQHSPWVARIKTDKLEQVGHPAAPWEGARTQGLTESDATPDTERLYFYANSRSPNLVSHLLTHSANQKLPEATGQTTACNFGQEREPWIVACAWVLYTRSLSTFSLIICYFCLSVYKSKIVCYLVLPLTVEKQRLLRSLHSRARSIICR